MSKVDTERRLADAEGTLELTEDRLLESEQRVVLLRERLLSARGLVARCLGYIGRDLVDLEILQDLETYLEVKDNACNNRHSEERHVNDGPAVSGVRIRSPLQRQ